MEKKLQSDADKWKTFIGKIQQKQSCISGFVGVYITRQSCDLVIIDKDGGYSFSLSAAFDVIANLLLESSKKMNFFQSFLANDNYRFFFELPEPEENQHSIEIRAKTIMLINNFKQFTNHVHVFDPSITTDSGEEINGLAILLDSRSYLQTEKAYLIACAGRKHWKKPNL